MLASPVRISGVVTDNQGMRLSDVWINHAGARVESIKTDSQGQFDIQTQAPAIVFRKSGFESRYWRVRPDRTLAIVLAGPAPLARFCGTSSRCLHLDGFMSAFCLPKIPGVNISKQGHDIDYGQRFFWVKTPTGKAGIQHAAGPMWGSGLPVDQDVWSARDYAEASYIDPEGFGIIDARGNSADGKYWRVLGHAFETASYRNVAERDTLLLDRVLDGICVERIRSQPH